MQNRSLKFPAALALAGALLGLWFGVSSTLDYAAHLDRGIHDLHCSIVPGAAATDKAEACRAAMYSPYSAILKTLIWGGIPISVFALGAFSFFAVYAAYLVLHGDRSAKWTRLFFAATAVTPLLVSLLMLTISLTELGSICLTCAGIYISSTLLGAGGIGVGLRAKYAMTGGAGHGGRIGAWSVALLSVLGMSVLVPAVTYAGTAPDHAPYLRDCGSLKVAPDAKHELMSVVGADPKRDAVFFEDPLCPTCRAFHMRLGDEEVLTRMSAQVVLFPLDSECNWMLGEPLHPGACMVSRALLCAADPGVALKWVFEEQPELAAAGKEGPKVLEAKLLSKFGPRLKDCMNSTKTKQRLNKHLHYAAENNVPLSTPQLYLGTDRVCDEDTDIGLSYTLRQLAPELLP